MAVSVNKCVRGDVTWVEGSYIMQVAKAAKEMRGWVAADVELRDDYI